MIGLRPAALAMVATALLGGCTSSNDISPAAQRIEAARSFGDDNRMTVVVEPGRIREIYEAEDLAWVAAVHFSAPFGSVRIDNGNFAEQRVLVEAGNVDVGASARPTLTALASGARRDSRCEDAALDARPELILAPLPNEQVFTEDGGPALLFDVRVPACSALEVELRLADNRTRWTTAVLAVDADDAGELREALDLVAASSADHVQYVGRSRRRADADPYGLVLLELSALGIPFSVTFVADDLGASAEFHEAFGVSDWDVALGRQRLLSLNTATRVVGVERFVWLQQRDVARWGGLAFMQVPPFDPDPSGSDAVATPMDAGRLLGVLGALGYRNIVSAAGDAPSSRAFAGVSIHDVGRAPRLRGAPRVTWVTVEQPWAAPSLCASDADCAGALVCDDAGFCAASCVADTDCPGTVCGARGSCEVSAVVSASASPP